MAERERQELCGSGEIAELFGTTERRVQQLAKEAIIPVVKKRPYRFDLFETAKAYIRHLSDKANGREETASAEKAKEDKMRAEADIKQSKAKIEELKLKELEGKMHRSEDVEAAVNDLVYTVKGMVMALPGRLAMDAAQTKSAGEASEVIRKECYKVLEELSNYKYDPETYRRRVREREGWDIHQEDSRDG